MVCIAVGRSIVIAALARETVGPEGPLLFLLVLLSVFWCERMGRLLLRGRGLLHHHSGQQRQPQLLTAVQRGVDSVAERRRSCRVLQKQQGRALRQQALPALPLLLVYHGAQGRRPLPSIVVVVLEDADVFVVMAGSSGGMWRHCSVQERLREHQCGFHRALVAIRSHSILLPLSASLRKALFFTVSRITATVACATPAPPEPRITSRVHPIIASHSKLRTGRRQIQH